MHSEAIIIQHRFSDQLMCVSLTQYRAGSRHRYRDWQLRGTAAFIAPPPLACLPLHAPPPPPDLTTQHAATAMHDEADEEGVQDMLADMAEMLGDMAYDGDAADDADEAATDLTIAQCLHATPQASTGDEYDHDYGYDHAYRLY